MKHLRGDELAQFIKQRHADRVRVLKTRGITPKLSIICVGDDLTSATYMRLKQRYAEDIGAEAVIVRASAEKLRDTIESLNNDDKTHGIIVQLPLPGVGDIGSIMGLINPLKDVDGLGAGQEYTSATAEAILWLLAGNSVDLKDKVIVVVGQGRLVGAPLTKLLQKSGHTVRALDEHSKDTGSTLRLADIIITAAGVPGLIQNSHVQAGVVVVDAGVTAEKGSLVGDVSDEVRQREDITITPQKGGVGPLTIAVLFDHLLTAAERAGQDRVF